MSNEDCNNLGLEVHLSVILWGFLVMMMASMLIKPASFFIFFFHFSLSLSLPDSDFNSIQNPRVASLERFWK